MSNMSLPGSFMGARRRARRSVDDFFISHARRAGWGAVRRASLSWCLFVFALLGMLSTRAIAAPPVSSPPHVMFADDSRQAVAPRAYGPVRYPDPPARDVRAHSGTVPGTPFASAPKDSGYAPSEPPAQDAKVTLQPWLSALAAALAIAMVVALTGACLSRAAWRRAAEKQKQIADQWARHCEATEATEAREQAAAHVTAPVHASAAGIPQISWPPCAIRVDMQAPLTAIADLLDSLDTTTAGSVQLARFPVIRSAIRTWSQTFSDLLDSSPLESHALIIDEGVTNLRELIDGVVALLAPSAMEQGLRLSASVDNKVAETILADRARLGQLCFHLLNRTIRLSTQEEIVLTVRSEPANSHSQRILISVTETGDRSAATALSQHPGFTTENPNTSKRLDDTDADACLQLCQVLARRMQGELSITRGPHAGARASFNAPFTVGERGLSSRPSPGALQAPLSPMMAMKPNDEASNAPQEPFEYRYLDALSEEGIDLRIFLGGWRRAMEDDLTSLGVLRRQGDPDRLYGVLHRLSGAVGLVGARSLMEALRRASTSPLEQSAGSIDALIDRARSLVKQLETLPPDYRSTQQ